MAAEAEDDDDDSDYQDEDAEDDGDFFGNFTISSQQTTSDQYR